MCEYCLKKKEQVIDKVSVKIYLPEVLKAEEERRVVEQLQDRWAAESVQMEQEESEPLASSSGNKTDDGAAKVVPENRAVPSPLDPSGDSDSSVGETDVVVLLQGENSAQKGQRNDSIQSACGGTSSGTLNTLQEQEGSAASAAAPTAAPPNAAPPTAAPPTTAAPTAAPPNAAPPNAAPPNAAPPNAAPPTAAPPNAAPPTVGGEDVSGEEENMSATDSKVSGSSLVDFVPGVGPDRAKEAEEDITIIAD
jgi:hypothetical protein